MTVDEWRERIEQCESPKDLYDLSLELLEEYRLVLSERDRRQLQSSASVDDFGGFPWE